VVWSRILRLFHINNHHVETTCRVQNLGCYLEGQGPKSLLFEVGFYNFFWQTTSLCPIPIRGALPGSDRLLLLTVCFVVFIMCAVLLRFTHASLISMFTVPSTNDSVFTEHEGRFSFPSSGELFYPYHNGVWIIDPPNKEYISVNIFYNVENCTDCECDKLEVLFLVRVVRKCRCCFYANYIGILHLR